MLMNANEVAELGLWVLSDISGGEKPNVRSTTVEFYYESCTFVPDMIERRRRRFLTWEVRRELWKQMFRSSNPSISPLFPASLR